MPTAAVIMDFSGALLNDPALTNFTYAAQLPYLKLAAQELREQLELNNVPYSNKTSTAITIVAGVVTLDFTTTPALPADLTEIQEIWERTAGVDEDYIPMVRKEFLPGYVVQTTCLIYWAWINQQVKFIGSTSDRQLRIDYIADPIAAITASSSTIGFINCNNFLSYRTAALCAQFIGENKERSDDLNVMAQMALDRVLGIDTKGRQAIAVRHRPFMAGYRLRGGYGY